MQSWSLKKRIYLGILLPSVASIVVISLYFNQLRINDALDFHYANGQQQSQTTARLLSPLIDAQQSELIDQLLTQVLQAPQISGVSLFSAEKKITHHQGENYALNFTTGLSEAANWQEYQQHWHFFVPINQRIDPQKKQAWLLLSYSKQAAILYNYDLIVFTLLVILIGCAVPSYIGWRSGTWIERNIMVLVSAIARIKDGDFTQPVQVKIAGALGRLAATTNSMIYTIRASTEELQQNIQQSEEDLKETLYTVELQNIELDNSRKEAEKASKIKSEFLANVSHEIRTPLSAIIGFANLLSKSQIDEQQGEYVQTIHSSSENLLSIINNVLDFSKIEAGKLVLSPIGLNLRELLEEVLAMLAPLAYEKQLELIQLIYSDVPIHIIVDPLRTKQILTNLISNAIKFTPSGSVTIRVELAETATENPDLEHDITIKISVTDTGIGLSNAQQKELFQAFTQGDTTTTRKFGGTGLGLVISKSLVEQMGGSIDLESAQGRGSTFWFTLPTSLSHGEHKRVHFDQLQQRNVLYIEPHSTTRLATNHLLTEWGISSTSSADEQQLLQELVNPATHYHALIIGVGQKNPSHQQALALLKRVKEVNHILVLVLSNSADTILQNEFISAGADVCLCKPIRYRQLYNSLLLLTSQNKIEPAQELFPTPANLANYRILAVDDNAANLKLACTLLKNMGLQVTGASSGVQAITLASQSQFDLIFMDIQMPDMDGTEACMRIRHNVTSGKHIPIIALSAHVLEEEKQTIMNAGMDDYLTKPIDENKIQLVLNKWLSKKVKPAEIQPPVKPKAVDYKLALKQAGGDQELADEIFQGLIDSLANEQKRINLAAANNDWEKVLEQVHKLHGLTHYAGVPLLQQQIQQFETALKRHQTESYQQQLEAFNQQAEQVLNMHQQQIAIRQ